MTAQGFMVKIMLQIALAAANPAAMYANVRSVSAQKRD